MSDDVGAFDGVGHIARLLDLTLDRALRCSLLRLIEALLAPQAREEDERASRAAAANGRVFVDSGGVQLAVDLMAGLVIYTGKRIFVTEKRMTWLFW